MGVKTSRRQYDKQFKIDAVELALRSDQTIQEIAIDLGIRPDLLYRWKSKYLAENEDAFPGTGNAKDAEAERVRQLERELHRVTEERDILKKACAVFTRTTP